MKKHIQLLFTLVLCMLLATACSGQNNNANAGDQNSNSGDQNTTQTDTNTNQQDTSSAQTGQDDSSAQSDDSSAQSNKPDTSKDTFSIELFTGLLGVNPNGLSEQMGAGTEVRDRDDNELEGYQYEGTMFGHSAIVEVDLDDGRVVDDINVYFEDLTAAELSDMVRSATANMQLNSYELECERTPQGSVLEISYR